MPAKPLSDEHRLEGIIIAAGNHVRPGGAAVTPSVLDVTPTVLWLLGLPVAEDMAGQVVRELIDLAYPPRTVPTYERAEARGGAAPLPSPMDDEIKQRLRSLGYIQ